MRYSAWKKGGSLTEFLKVTTSDQFMACLRRFPRLAPAKIPLDGVLHRIAATDLVALEDLPPADRSTVDGYAVRAEDTFGACDSIPALFEIIGMVDMGAKSDLVIHRGQAAQIPTGGYLPEGADAVVMVEYCNPAGAHNVEVTRPVSTRANVLQKGEDAKCGETLIKAGRLLRPCEIGLLAASGISEILACPSPRVAVISTGDEIIPIEQKPLPGQIRDANAHSIAALIRDAGATPIPFDIVPDDAAALRHALEIALADADIVVLSGGSSVGARDLMVDVAGGLPDAEVLAHGISIRPGKPTLLVSCKGKALLGLPGHPVSALIVAQIFLSPFLRYLQGAELVKGPAGKRVTAVLSTSIHAAIGVEEYIRVRLEGAPDAGWRAFPVFGKSGMLSTLVNADGVMVIPMNCEGVAKGESVEVIQI
jgi:molybdopterin molybdotransferase